MRLNLKIAFCTICVLLGCGGKSVPTQPIIREAINWTTFHGDAQRLGSDLFETVLTPAGVASGNFGPIWNSPQLDSVTSAGVLYPPHLYATPLYVDDVLISAGMFSGLDVSVIFAATSNGWLYAINAFDKGSVPAGTILWSTMLGQPAVITDLDGGIALGVLSTPVIDLKASPPRLYVASDVSDSNGGNWTVYALNIQSGSVLSGWPVRISGAAVALVNKNGPAIFQSSNEMSQRGALNLSPDGRLLYVPFASYAGVSPGFLIVVDTENGTIASAFSSAPSLLRQPSGGVWGSGGPAIDAQGRVYETTGDSPDGTGDAIGVWGNSLLAFEADVPLRLVGTYTPWNYCQMDTADSDLGASSPVIVPDLDPSTTSTPHLIAFGGKQGVVYLINRDSLPGRLDKRQSCNTTDSGQDRSLLATQAQPPFGLQGPLSVFGPYSETCTALDRARMRTTPAYFRSADGSNFIFVSGAQKQSECDRTPVPPGLVRLKVITSSSSQPASLKIDASDSTLRLFNPGPPVISSNNGADAIVWILDANLYRSMALTDSATPRPVLYAVDANTMQVLWQSNSTQLNVGGKYNHVLVAHGVVFVGTDRIQAFGLRK